MNVDTLLLIRDACLPVRRWVARIARRLANLRYGI